jgi:hypothetical protein
MKKKIEFIESLINDKQSQLVIDGLMCIQMCVDIAATNNVDLVKELENGRG